ncbi:TIR domain-containing protein [Legionella hackeliae]|uniref:TIR domain-containing protein n=1 Tax=Legionella hackeliae TaxID=449 RepID=A0A0A8UVU4_LEGHA|nr:toll/interleukin-1 receptor domain-containing protein [Legionella hackeliae]KTD14704.1 hypothetical protein Lhac_0468 [Legionella hackeliae]CEK11601.1 protein of unknown function [coiled-coil domain] [Legionella hackeliae]STX48371.1 Uncharacterised protein [Legionella hackeliae]
MTGFFVKEKKASLLIDYLDRIIQSHRQSDYSILILVSLRKLRDLHDEAFMPSSPFFLNKKLHKSNLKKCLRQVEFLVEELNDCEKMEINNLLRLLKNLYRFYSGKIQNNLSSSVVNDFPYKNQLQILANKRNNQILLSNLSKIKSLTIAESFSVPPKIFISYAWPYKDDNAEYWIQPYLVNLAKHLKMSGAIVKLDIITNSHGARIQGHLKEILDSDFILLIGTPSLKRKYEDKNFHVIQDEISAMMQNNGKIIPILVFGDFYSSFPYAFQRNISIEDWRTGDYVNHLKELCLSIYSDKKETLVQVWQDNSVNEFHHLNDDEKKTTVSDSSVVFYEKPYHLKCD